MSLNREESHNYALEIFRSRDLRCPVCSVSISYEKRTNKHCSKHCAAKASNARLYPVENRKRCKNCDVIMGSVNDRKFCTNQCRELYLTIRKSRLTVETAKTPLSIRKVLIRDFGNKCMICQNSEWLGKPIPIEVDHINGLSWDNKPSNLRLLCHNCHAQTPTFRSKNRGNGRPGRRRLNS